MPKNVVDSAGRIKNVYGSRAKPSGLCVELIALGRVFAACLVVGCVLYTLQFVARALARRSATAMPGGRIVAILETTALPGAASLHVVRVAERYLLVGRSASAMTTLCEIPSEHMAAARESSGRASSARAGGGLARLFSSRFARRP